MSKTNVVDKISDIRNNLTNTITFSNSGSKLNNVYKFEYRKGVRLLCVQDEKDNIYEKIQSYKDDTNIYKILNRVLQGDYSVLDKNQGIGFDNEHFPKSINDYHEYVQRCKYKFNTLSPDIKLLFGNNFEQFAHEMQNGTAIDKVEKYNSRFNKKNENINVSLTKDVGEKKDDE